MPFTAGQAGHLAEHNALDGRYVRGASSVIDAPALGLFFPEAHGATGDGVSDDTAGVAAAITAAGATGCVFLAFGKTYSTTGNVLGNYTKVRGYGATLALRSGVGPILTAPAQGALQTAQYSSVEGVLLDGVNTAAGSVGLKVLSHAAFISKDVRATRCEAGFDMRGHQFGSHYSPKAYLNTVGFYLESTAGGGGGNSLTFYDLQAVGNTVGFIANKAGAYPLHSVVFRNPSLLSNTVCGIALFGTDHFVIDGSAPESNASGAATATFNGLTVKKSSCYLNGANLTHVNGFIAEGAADPCFLLENNSKLSLTDCSGYGNTTGRFVSADSTSSVTISGEFQSIGTVEGVSSFTAMVRGSTLVALTSPITSETSTIPNTVSQPQIATPADTNGATNNGLARDSTFGEYTSVTFPASPAGRIRWALTNSGTLATIGFLVQSSVDAVFLFGESGNFGNKLMTFRAGVWTRVAWAASGVTAGAVSFVLTPQDSAGTTLKVCKLHHFTGADTFDTRRQTSRVFGGAYNPNVKALKTNDEATAAPTTGTWVLGDIVWHSAPATGGNIGFVCTTAGTPGTWKNFGTIA